MSEQVRPSTDAKATPDGVDPEALDSSPPWHPGPAHIQRFKSLDELSDAAARRFADSAKRAVDKADRFIVALAGGSTPRGMYRRLTEAPYRDEVPWHKTYFVFGDERCVPPDDEASNYRMAFEALFGPLEISNAHILRMKGEQVPTEAARRYEVRLGDLFLNRPKRHIDLVLLGIGADGHTASLFPETAALEEKERWVAANHVPQLDAWRLTLTYPALNSARRVMFMATGEDKAQVIAEAFGGVPSTRSYPCQGVAPFHARREVLIDEAAASRIPESQDRS